ncbi:MAG: hypothetical protein ACOX8X_06520 [Methanomethylophilus sp.]|jgi:hypothetical protein
MRDALSEIGKLRGSEGFRAYSDIRAVSLYFAITKEKCRELVAALETAASRPPEWWRSYERLERESLVLSQALADFLSRMYFCKNHAASCARRYGLEREFKEIRKRIFGPESAIIIGLRNYTVHIDMAPLAVGPGGRPVFTERCRSDPMWSPQERRILRKADPEDLILAYCGQMEAVYLEFGEALAKTVRPKMRECRREIKDFNSAVGFEMIRYEAPWGTGSPPGACPEDGRLVLHSDRDFGN